MRVIFDALQANHELRAVASAAGITLRDLMYNQARLLAQDAVRRTPPGKPGDNVSTQKKAGVNATTGDIEKMFWGVDRKAEVNRMMKQAAKAGGVAMVQTNQGEKMLVSSMILPDASGIPFAHRSKRNRKGRVMFRGDSSLMAAGKYIVARTDLNRFIRAQVKKVGQLKAGFIPAADYFAALGGTTAKRIPAWVRKQIKMGSQVNGVNRKTGTGFIVVSNDVPYADTAITKSLQNFLERTRQTDINKHAKKRMNQLARAHNDKYARAA